MGNAREALVRLGPMASTTALIVSMFAIIIGLLVAGVGVDIMLESGTFAEGEGSSSNGILGIGGGSSERAEVSTPAFVGLIMAVLGGAGVLLGFGGLISVSARIGDG